MSIKIILGNNKRFISRISILIMINIVAMLIILLLLQNTQTVPQRVQAAGQIKHVFIIMEENHNWSAVKSQPYISSLVSQGAHAEQDYNPPGLHPSEPNYVYLEAATNNLPGTHNFPSDGNPGPSNSTSSTNHLVTFLNNAGYTWKVYAEDISGSNCPMASVGNYAPKHVGMMFFQDVTGNNNPQSQYCMQHIRPYSDLVTDLQNGTAPNYSFIVPNLQDDMHDGSVQQGDQWLSSEMPKILNSQVFKSDGAVFVTWDEGSGGDGPIGMIALSPFAKVNYLNTIHYTHSSFVKTVEEIFGLTPLLADAANATDYSDFFTIPLNGGTFVTPTIGPTITKSPIPTLTPTNIPTPSYVTPTLYCLGSCPTLPPSETPSPSISGETPTINPSGVTHTPSNSPKDENQEKDSNKEQENSHSKHKHHKNGEIRNNIDMLMKLINDLLKQLQKLLG